MSEYNKDFQMDVIDRLARMETKIDTMNGSLKQHTKDIDNLKDANLVAITERKTLKKIITVFGGSLGILATVIGILSTMGRI
jgi:flagellar motor component MotA